MTDLTDKVMPPITAVMNKRWILAVAIPFLLLTLGIFLSVGSITGFEGLVKWNELSIDEKIFRVLALVSVTLALYFITEQNIFKYSFAHDQSSEASEKEKIAYDRIMNLDLSQDPEDHLGQLLLFQRLSIGSWLLWLVWNPVASAWWMCHGHWSIIILPFVLSKLCVFAFPMLEPVNLGDLIYRKRCCRWFNRTLRLLLWTTLFIVGAVVAAMSLHSNPSQLGHKSMVLKIFLIESLMYVAVIFAWSRAVKIFLGNYVVKTAVSKITDPTQPPSKLIEYNQ